MKMVQKITGWSDDFDDNLDRELESLKSQGYVIIDIKFSTQLWPSKIEKERGDNSSLKTPYYSLVYSALIIFEKEEKKKCLVYVK